MTLKHYQQEVPAEVRRAAHALEVDFLEQTWRRGPTLQRAEIRGRSELWVGLGWAA